MKLFLLTFLLIFFSGVALLAFFKMPSTDRKLQKPSVPARESLSDEERHKNKLLLPDFLVRDETGKNSWEYSGVIPMNFVTAKMRVASWFIRDSWKGDRQITLDSTLKPQIILTFLRGEHELTVFLWKIDTNSTGFSCKREKILMSEFDKTSTKDK